MESIGLLTPPDQRISMSWSTFWRRPEGWKLVPSWLAFFVETFRVAMFGLLSRVVLPLHGTATHKRGLAERFENLIALVELRQSPKSAKLVKLARRKNRHIPADETAQCLLILGDELCCGT